MHSRHGKKQKAVALVFFVLLFPSSSVHEKGRQNNKAEVPERKPTKKQKLLPCADEIKDLPFQKSYSWIDLDENFVLFDSELHFGWSYSYRAKT